MARRKKVVEQHYVPGPTLLHPVEAIWELNSTVRHAQTPTIACDECGKVVPQTQVAPWQSNDARGELMLCRGKNGCLAKAKAGAHMTAYDKLSMLPLQHIEHKHEAVKPISKKWAEAIEDWG